MPHGFVRRPFRFGVQLSSAPTGNAWAGLGRQLEDLGYDTASMPDHFTEQLAPMPALQAIADATTSLRVGALVFDNDYKHPVVLAKELATMDVLSNGRVDIGIGAGWMESDYVAAGMQYDRPGVRVDRFEEALKVIKGVMGPGPFSFSGQHYTINDYNGLPKPVQGPCPPVLIGGGGKRVLAIAAREADIVGINASMAVGAIGPDALASMTYESVTEKVAHVGASAGTRVGEIALNIRVFFVSVTDHPDEQIGAIASMFAVEPDMVRASPYALVGDVASIVDQLQQRRDEFEFSYVIVGQNDIEPFAPVVAALAGT